ncbi:hypothetical protein [Alkaliphilus peptidifermentans]|uniref:DUF86 domain-containing protein n=1 Tax=Alkaliphilus peptidifermentans DSM 18978 TaxID=1120976 RepID=A0A1G5ADN2_9FIRM|nr:hypothetical protein [Alkaliphilus peptidifermentans]SCX75990.1 hypothetical protein SAMN03080606_00076 [Alkaliphilus peptidifermentans DSM 18978]
MEEIRRKLNKLDEYAEILSVASTYSKEDFINNPLIYGGAERFTILGYQNILEVSTLVIKHCQFPNTKNLIKTLESNRVFPNWLSANINGRIKYIYTLEYDYLKLMNKDELYNLLPEIVSDLRHFRKYVLEYVV